MPLEIEDGTGKPDAQSYATVAELAAYAAQRGVELPATEAERERLLLDAADFLEKLDSEIGFVGVRATRAQALAWPRMRARVHGFEILLTEIPNELKKAQLQLALDAMTVPLLPTSVAPERGAVIEEAVEGAVSTKYAAPSAPAGDGLLVGAQLTRAAAFVKPLLRADAPLLQVPIGRA